MAQDKPTVVERIMERVQVDPVTGCWLWQGCITSWGYGVVYDGPNQLRVHRVIYAHHRGPIPKGLDVDHVCHNEDKSCAGGKSCIHRRCVNPDHLRAASRRDNLNAGRGAEAAKARFAAITHCPQGHEYTPENTYTHIVMDRYIGRQCRTCVIQKSRARQQRLAAERKRSS